MKIKMFSIKQNLSIEILLCILLVLSFFLVSKVKPSQVEAACYSCCVCSTCCGSGGCRFNPPACYASEFSANCGGSNMCCDLGDCNACSVSCGTGYQSSNNSCATQSFSCTKTYCYGGSCGTTSITCYRVRYTVTINANSGTCDYTSSTPCGSTANAAPNCSRTGYTRSSYSVTAGTCGGTFTSSTGICSSVTQAITIAANWTINSYAVTVNANGGSCSPGTHNVNYGSASTSQSCTRTGYTLSSLSVTTGTCGGTFNSSTGVCSSITGAITITANWTINSYAVTVSGNGGSCSPGTHNVNYGSASTSQSCTRTGYTFNSFSVTTGTCGGTFTPSTGVCSSITGAITITASWTINSYQVTVSGNGGSCDPGTHSVNYGSASTSQSCTWDASHQFDLFTQTGCGGTFSSSTGVCSSVTQAMSITANWQYLVTVDANGGSCSPDDHFVSYNTTSSNPNCTRTGYTLTQYDLTGTCGGTFTSSTGICSAVTQLITVTAQWLINNLAPHAPTTPYCNGVTNPTDVTTSNPTFSAYFSDPDSADTGNYYEIEVNTASDFTGTVMWDTGIQSMTPISNNSRSSNVSYAGSTLGWAGTTYYWRIRFGDQEGSMSNWSVTQNFTMHSNTNPSAPTGLQTEQATNPTQLIDTTPEFRAVFNDSDTGDTGVQYEIEVNSNNTFTGTVMWDTGLQSMTPTSIGNYSPEVAYNGIELTLNGVTYYWRIRFVDNYSGVSDWSATAQFAMNNIPTATNLKINGQTNPLKIFTASNPYFTAYFSDADSGATGTHYEIEVNTSSDFGGTVMWDSNQTVHSPAITNNSTSNNITYSGTSLTDNGATYYWRIRFWDNVGTPSSWSSTANFIMSGAPLTPTGLLVDGRTNPISLDSLTPTFSAIYEDPNSDTASAYEIEVNSNSLFNGTIMWDTSKTTTSISNNSRSPDYVYAGTPLTGGSAITYYWRIRFWDSDDLVSGWSTTATFVDDRTHLYIDGLQLGGLSID